MKTLNQRERNDAVPAPFGTHSFGRFRWFWRCKTCLEHLSGQLVNIAEDFTPQSNRLVPIHKYRSATCRRNGAAAFHRWSSGYSAQFLPSSLFGCLHNSVLDCFVKSFPNIGPNGTNEREDKN